MNILPVKAPAYGMIDPKTGKRIPLALDTKGASQDSSRSGISTENNGMRVTRGMFKK